MQRQQTQPLHCEDCTTIITIQKQNTNKSLIAQLDMLQQLDPEKIDITVVQEPYLDHLHNTHANQHWYTLYPRVHYMAPPKNRSVLLINKRILADSWVQVELGSSDITAVQI